MEMLTVKLFNTPYVKKGDKLIVFPFKKAEALFYYMLIKKQATRDELVNIFWGDNDDETARKNLRNAIYTIKKVFDEDILTTPNRSIVAINENIGIETDLQNFLNEKDMRSIEQYSGDFLQGFAIKDSEQFEQWVVHNRELLREIYIKRLYSAAIESFNTNAYEQVERYVKLIAAEDEYDERAYCLLMKVYALQGQQHKAVEIYNKLEKGLREELGITPAEETKKLLQEILTSQNSAESALISENEGFFYGREFELSELLNYYSVFSRGRQGGAAIAVRGEAGIGKTRLKERFLRLIPKNESIVLETNCYQAEEGYRLRPWSDILYKLSDAADLNAFGIPESWRAIISNYFPRFASDSPRYSEDLKDSSDPVQFKLLEDAILGMLERISIKHKLVIVFEDVQWMDSPSMALLLSIMLHHGTGSILLFITCRNESNPRLDSFLLSLERYKSIKIIDLERFTRVQTVEFSEKALPFYEWTEENKNKVYEETEGNAFFLTELINTIKEKGCITDITDRAQGIIKSRFIDLPKDCIKLLHAASIFFDRVSMSMLKNLCSKDELELMDNIEMLQGKMILKEVDEDGEPAFKFTHLKLREYIYNQLSEAKRRLIHHKAGIILESKLSNNRKDIHLYPYLIYHFENSGDLLLEVKYKLKNLNYYLDLNHELFPVFTSESDKSYEGICINGLDIIPQLDVLEQSIEATKRKGYENVEIFRLEIIFLHLKGRYLIREGDYEKGLICISAMIDKALAVGDFYYCIKGYKQLIYYGIQIHSTDIMDKYINLAVQCANEHFMEELGILFRLKGLSRLMKGSYEEAEELLKQALGLLNSYDTKDGKYSLNIAACYNYLGEIRRYGMRFSWALDYYDKAIKICEDMRITAGASIFYTNAGQAAFDMGDYHRAKSYFNRAIKLYDKQESYWGRSTTEGYFSLLLIKDGFYKDALEYLKKAELHAEKLKSPYELGLMFRVKAEIKSKMYKNKQLDNVFCSYLHQSLDEYCNRGLEMLAKANNPYEMEILKALGKGNK
ncbi:MAG: AAA family ATPase [Bacillota bacterium]